MGEKEKQIWLYCSDQLHNHYKQIWPNNQIQALEVAALTSHETLNSIQNNGQNPNLLMQNL